MRAIPIRRASQQFLVLITLLLCFAFPAYAQSFPNRPITIVVPFAPGGGNDVMARIVGKGLSQALGQPVVVDNRPGGGGIVGEGFVARSPADGYTLLMINTVSHVALSGLHAKLPYDPGKDFTAVGSMANATYVVVVHPSVPARTLPEFVKYAKARPHQLNYASGGIGSVGHMAGEFFKTSVGVDLLHVPYKGGAPAIADVIGGNVQMMIENMGSVVSHLQQGKLRGLAVTSRQRSDSTPDLPTVEESGYAGFEVVGRYGLLAPAATPREVVTQLNAALVAAVNSPDVRVQMAAQGVAPQTLSPQEFQDIVKSEAVKWHAVIRNSDIKPE